MNFYLYSDISLYETLKEIIETMGFFYVEDEKNADIIFFQFPFQIENPESLKLKINGREKILIFIPEGVINEIKESRVLESKYKILKPKEILNFISYVKEKIKNES